ncbi:MAG: DedA family protein [Candidatus Latescibacteria bacterium]|nr:DedA family protein [Candidatus Latescibacterota bacterium]
MEEYLIRLSAELGQWPPALIYGALVLSAFLENVIPPVPGDTVVVFSAYLVGRGVLGLWPVYLATCAGGLAGFLAMYYLGYSHGRTFFATRGRRLFSAENIARAEAWLSRYGVALVAANRFLSGVRSVIALAAGMGRMEWKRVAFWGLVSIALWNGLMFYAGLLVGQHWQRVLEYLEEYNRVLSGVLVLVGLALAWRWWRRRSGP